MKRLGSFFRSARSRRSARPQLPRTPRNLRKGLGFEPLEARRVLAAVINEFHFSPTFGDAEIHQYLEFRGEPGAAIAPGTYFVGVESAEGINDLGDIQTIIDLSNETFGSNGLLVLLPSGHGFTTDAAANVLTGTDGFNGLPGGMFVSDGGANIVRAGSSTYFLIQSDIPPSLTDDLDIDDNGTPDGPYTSWTIYDSVSVLPFFESAWTQSSFGRIVFAEDGVGDTYLAGSTVIEADRLGYIGRIGDSLGFTGEDWVTGNTVEVGDETWDFQLQHGVFGTPRPYAYGGRFLDHIGGSNWFGSIEGTVFRDDNADGAQQGDEPAIGGVDVLADFNGDGETGYYWETIDADAYELGTDLSNISSNVTIVSAGADNVHQGFKILASQEPQKPVGQNVFSHAGVTFFNENRRLRMDFYDPVRSVSIDVIGNSDTTPTYGRLELFNKDDVSLGFIRTDPLSADQLETLSLTRPQTDIAWALAYPEDSYLDSSEFGRLDNLRIEMREAAAVTNSEGRYVLRDLTTGVYPISIDDTVGYTQVFPTGGADHNVDVAYGNVANVNFGLQGTEPPSLDDQSIDVGELLGAGGVVASLPVMLGYPTQELSISTLSGDPAGLFSIDPLTFDLILNRAELDYETTNAYALEIELVDTVNGGLNDTAKIDLTVLDQNDAPVVTDNSATIAENSVDGLSVATMQGSDEDSGPAGTLQWSIVDGNTGDAFAIDAQSGEVTVANGEALNFEAAPLIELQVQATDAGTPVNFGIGLLTVNLTDINEPPRIPAQAFGILENSQAGTIFGQVLLEEQDANQTAAWSVTGGDGQALFVLDSAGELSVAEGAVLDFEEQSSYTLEVSAVDSGTPPQTGTGVVTINLVDVNDAPLIEPQSFELPEDAPSGQLVGTVIAEEQDAGQALVYSITGGSHASSFDVDSVTGELSVAEGAELDFESQPAATVEITVADNNSPSASSSALITVDLQDVNEAPEIVTDRLDIPENSAVGSVVGVIQVDDPDAGDSLTYAIESQVLSWVEIDSATGELRVAAGANIDFEVQSQNEILVSATDSSDLKTEKTVTLNATDVNDPPVLEQPIEDAQAEVAQLYELVLPEDMFSDQDAGDSLQVSVTSADGFSLPQWLDYDSGTRTLSGTPAESDIGDVDVKVTAFDTQGDMTSDIFKITVVASEATWHNSEKPFDTTGDGFISPIDVLYVVNYLNSNNPPQVPDGQPPEFGMVDVNNDGFVTPIDALLPTNYLNGGGAPEGEFNGNYYVDWGEFDKTKEEENDWLQLLSQDPFRDRV